MVSMYPEHVVEHAMGLLAKAGPIVGVERGACRWCRHMHSFGSFVFSQKGPPVRAASRASLYKQLECHYAHGTLIELAWEDCDAKRGLKGRGRAADKRRVGRHVAGSKYRRSRCPREWIRYPEGNQPV